MVLPDSNFLEFALRNLNEIITACAAVTITAEVNLDKKLVLVPLGFIFIKILY